MDEEIIIGGNKKSINISLKNKENTVVEDEANLIASSELSNVQFNALIRVSS